MHSSKEAVELSAWYLTEYSLLCGLALYTWGVAPKTTSSEYSGPLPVSQHTNALQFRLCLS